MQFIWSISFEIYCDITLEYLIRHISNHLLFNSAYHLVLFLQFLHRCLKFSSIELLLLCIFVSFFSSANRRIDIWNNISRNWSTHLKRDKFGVFGRILLTFHLYFASAIFLDHELFQILLTTLIWDQFD